MVGAIVLLRYQPGDGLTSVTTLYASSSKYDLLDELQRVSHRVFMLGEGETIVAEMQHA